MDKYLVLGFKNAGLFRKHKKTKDKIFDFGETRDRINELEFVEPITVHQISNMLHVLFGKRPKPTRRFTFYDRVEYLFDKANASYLKITTYQNADGEYSKETLQTKKAVHNSWYPNKPNMNWEKVRKFFEPKLFDEFISVLTSAMNINPLDYTFNEIIKLIHECDNLDLKQFLSKENLMKEGKTSFHTYLYGKDKEGADINKNSRTILTVLSGLDSVIRLDGEILVPVSDEDIEMIRNGSGCAKILDNGLVYIKGIKHQNVINPEGFTLVSNISLTEQ